MVGQPHSKLNAIALAAVVLMAGCAGWQARNFDMSQLRDERASDIDQRLSSAKSAVQSPFDGSK